MEDGEYILYFEGNVAVVTRVTTLLGIALATCLSLFQHAQVQIVDEPQKTSAELEKSKNDDAESNAALYRQLGLYQISTHLSCWKLSDVSLKRMWSSGPYELSIIEAHSDPCAQMFLIVYLRNGNIWKNIGTIPLPTKYSVPVYSVQAMVRGDDVPLLAVSGIRIDAGAGYAQTNTRVYRYYQGRTRIVLDEPQSLSIDVGDKRTVYRETQVSVFRFEPIKKDEDGYISEKRRISVNGRVITDWRNHVWSEDMNQFLSVGSAPSSF